MDDRIQTIVSAKNKVKYYLASIILTASGVEAVIDYITTCSRSSRDLKSLSPNSSKNA